jgi:hypothetical protein
MRQVSNEQPHVLILAGPFVNLMSEDVQRGDLRYKNPETEEIQFIDYDQLTLLILNFIHRELGQLTT